MRLVVLSCTRFGRKCLDEAIIKVPEVTLAGIVTTPRVIDFSESSEPLVVSNYSDFKSDESIFGCPVFQLDKPPDATRYFEILSDLDAQLVLALGWYFLIPQKVLESVPGGFLGIHGSMLPKYRGMSPVTWVLINGESETGVSLFYLEKGVDTGDIVAQRRIAIDEEDDCKTLYGKVTDEAIKLLREYLPRLANGTARRVPQDHERASQFGRRTEKDGHIDWRHSTQTVYNFIRAQTRPYPGAFSFLGGTKLRLWRAELSDMPRPEVRPGQIIMQGGRPRVATGDGVLILDDYSIERSKDSTDVPSSLKDGDLLA